MKEIDILKNKLVNAGKLKKISLYNRIIKIQFLERDKSVFSTCKSALQIYREYLEFDNSPPDNVNNEILEIFTHAFAACRKAGSPAIFRALYKNYSSFSHLFKDSELLALLYSHLNYLFWLDNKYELALDYGIKSINELDECGNERILPGRYSNVGYIYECCSDFDKAEEFYEKGLQFGLRINSDQVICLAYCGYGRINLTTGNFPLAVNFFKEALEFFPKKDADYISVINNLGIALARMGKNAEAVQYFSRFINDKTKEENPDAYIDILMNCASSHLAMNELEIAEKQLLEVLEIARSFGVTDIVTGILVNLGNLENMKENPQKAAQYFTESLKSNQEIDEQRYKMLAYMGLGSACRVQNNFSKSKNFLSIALKIALELQQIPEIIIIRQQLAEIFENEKDYLKALKQVKKLNELQLQEKEKKYSLSLRQLKKDFQKKQKNLTNISYDLSNQLISRELSEKLKSPLIGVSSQMQKVVEHAFIAADNPETPVLITGDSGTGKDIIARLIHYAGKRKNNPFVVVNTAAFTDSLIESAFFGSEKGAYTGADSLKIGYFEAAMGGSLFLDEIGDMPRLMQIKFLRVLEQKVMQRIGSIKDIPLDFRLISASNKNLHQLSQNNEFRFDLLNRINTIEINIPPLSQRTDDIPILIDYFIKHFSSLLNKKSPIVTKNALEMLISYHYPGNVRELKNIIHRSLMFNNKPVIDSSDIMLHYHQFNEHFADSANQNNLNLKSNEELLIKKAMDECHQIQLHAAKLLGISPYALNRKLKKMAEKNLLNNSS